MTKLKKLIIAVPILLLVYGGYNLYQDIVKSKSEDPLVWVADILALEEQLLIEPAKDGSILFIGSSSIRFWDSIAQDMKPFDVVQRGFGGSKLLDVVHYADRLLEIGAQPAAIGVFVGTNDVHPGAAKDPALLLQRYQEFIKIVRNKYSDTPVYYIAITPSEMRWEVWDVAQHTNRLISDYSNTQDKLFVIDVGASLLGSDGKPDSDLYRLDGLHLNEKGYTHWSKAILSRLLADL